MSFLSSQSSASERALIVALEADPSAPVRACLAQIVGKAKREGEVPILLRLLYDRRNYARHPEWNQRDEPQYQVARTAASALAVFKPLTESSQEAIISFLRSGIRVSADVEVHVLLIQLLQDIEHSDATALLGTLMTDERVVGDKNENLYPIRYAAAWALFSRLQQRPFERDLVPWHIVEAAADHFDPQLAAGALCALGAQLETQPTASALAALRGECESDVRKALALAMIDDQNRAREIAFQYDLLSSEHPLFKEAPGATVAEPALPPWNLTAASEIWIRSLAGGNDVESVLLKVISARTGRDFGVSDFDVSALRRRRSVPIMTFAELFGME